MLPGLTSMLRLLGATIRKIFGSQWYYGQAPTSGMPHCCAICAVMHVGALGKVIAIDTDVMHSDRGQAG